MHIEVRLPVAADAVFDAWLLPEVMQRWLFVGPSNKIVEVTSDERAGGKFYIREENNGKQIDHYGEYLRVERPTLIEFTLEFRFTFEALVTSRSSFMQPKAAVCWPSPKPAPVPKMRLKFGAACCPAWNAYYSANQPSVTMGPNSSLQRTGLGQPLNSNVRLERHRSRRHGCS